MGVGNLPRRRAALAIVVSQLVVLASLAGPVSAGGGPNLVKDIAVSGGSGPGQLTAVGDTLFFSATGPGGQELWKSDGTPEGTQRVKNIRPGSRSSWPTDLTNVGGTLFFNAFDGADWAIWKSDGTEAGTQIVAVMDARELTSFRGQLFFVSFDELWRTDGTLSGTTAVKQIASHPDTFILELEVVGNRLFLSVGEGGDTDELWMSDGTAAGTILVKSIDHDGQFAGTHTLTKAGGRLFFLRDEEANVSFRNSAQLWTSNGTPGGTKLVKDFVPGDLDYVYNLIAARGRAFFFANDRLWKSTGTLAGTKKLSDIAVNYGHPLTNSDGSVYFVGVDGIWKSDGTLAGTQQVTTAVPYVNPFCNPHGPCSFVFRDYDPVGVAGQLVYPSDQETFGVELWMTDTTSFGSHPVADIRPGEHGSRPADLTRVGDAVFFTANDGTHGRELWRYIP